MKHKSSVHHSQLVRVRQVYDLKLDHFPLDVRKCSHPKHGVTFVFLHSFLCNEGSHERGLANAWIPADDSADIDVLVA